MHETAVNKNENINLKHLNVNQDYFLNARHPN